MVSPEELKRVYDEHAEAAFGLFLNFARNDSDARDLLQDWLVKIGRGLDTLDGIGNAVLSSESGRPKSGLSFPERFFGGILIAAWLVIVGLWISTPDDTLPPAYSEAKPTQSSVETYASLAARLSRIGTIEELLP